MQGTINKKYLCIIIMALLVCGSAVMMVMLLNKHQETIRMQVRQQSTEASLATFVENIMQHVNYDGKEMNGSLTAVHYNRNGRIVEQGMTLNELLKGKKAVLLVTQNGCHTCVENEISAFNDLYKAAGKKDVAIIADYAMHEHLSMALKVGFQGFYEINGNASDLGIGEMPEGPLLMFVENGRITTSFVVEQNTSGYSEIFHKFLLKKLQQQ